MPDPTRLEPKLPPGGALSASSFSQPRQQAATQREIGEEMNRQLRTSTGPSAARAELQVSLLNEIGLTLTAMARALDDAKTLANQRFSLTLAMSENVGDIRDVLHIHRLSLEGIQGLLVDLDAKVDESAEAGEKRLAAIEELLAGIGVLGAKLDAHDGHLTAIDIASYEGTQRILKERGERLDRIEAMLERMVTEIDHVAKRYSHVATRLAQIELRISHIGAQLTVFAQEKPRKAGKRKGKRPVRKSS